MKENKIESNECKELDKKGARHKSLLVMKKAPEGG